MKAFETFLRSLNDAGVEYVVGGGHAVMFHGYPRSTDDLELLYRPTSDNAARLADAVRPYVPQVSADDFLGPRDEFAIVRTAGVRVDLLPEITGVDTDDAIDTAVSAELFDVPVRFISRALLLSNKRSTSRLKDAADAEELEAPTDDHD